MDRMDHLHASLASTPSGSNSPTASIFNLPPTPTHNTPDPRILIIMTGGTICMTPTPSGLAPARGFLDTCLRPRPVFNDMTAPITLPIIPHSGATIQTASLRTPPSKHGKRIRYCALEFNPLLDSSSIDARGWGLIAEAIQLNYTLFDGFVVLHGTDSLAYTCSALSFMCSDLGKPVVFTGSQSPMSQLYSDATDNLLGALIVASHYMIPEVCLFFADKLFRGNRTQKVNAHDFAAFATPNLPPLARMGVSVKVNWELVHRPRELRRFRVRTKLPETSHVACLRVFPGMLPAMVRGVLGLEGLRGLVLETFGSGNAPGDEELLRVLREACARGIVIVSVTQCQIGSVTPLYASGTALALAGVVSGLDMTSEAALTKLAVLLANPELTPADIRVQMSQSLRGELTEVKTLSFRHPDLGVAEAVIRGGVEEVVDVLERGEEGVLVNWQGGEGDTLLHLVVRRAVEGGEEEDGKEAEVLRELLQRGASVHIRNKEGRTAFGLACEGGWEVGRKLLEESGAHLAVEEVGQEGGGNAGSAGTTGN